MYFIDTHAYMPPVELVVIFRGAMGRCVCYFFENFLANDYVGEFDFILTEDTLIPFLIYFLSFII